MDKLRGHRGHDVWNRYLEPLAGTIFNEIKKTEKLHGDELPLHLFAKFPFEVWTPSYVFTRKMWRMLL